jgi:hypothetical protein
MSKQRTRPVYRKNAANTVYLKVYPDNSNIRVEPENLFAQAKVEKQKSLEKSIFKTLTTCPKSEFMKVYRAAKLALRV